MRRVVTVHDPAARSVVAFDGSPPNVGVRRTGVTRSVLWSTAATPAAFAREDRGALPVGPTPPPGGSVFHIVEIPPGDPDGDPTIRGLLAEMGLPPLPGRRAARHPLMHATDSLDYAIVLEGEVDMLLDDVDVRLYAGDAIVQQGTNHAWVNRGERPCRIAFVMIDAGGSPLVPAE
jgi:mannose-6-phosphate isomerase-like protein (cupin superfamily)